jgi:hypothetical protein
MNNQKRQEQDRTTTAGERAARRVLVVAKSKVAQLPTSG